MVGTYFLFKKIVFNYSLIDHKNKTINDELI